MSADAPNPRALRVVEDLYGEPDLDVFLRSPTPPLHRPPPRLIDPSDWRHLACWDWMARGGDVYDRSREAYAVRVPDAFVEGCSRCHWEGTVYDRERVFLLNSALTPCLPPHAPRAPIEVPRLVTVIQRLASDYYHFVVDTLPKLLLLRPLLTTEPGYRLLVHQKPWVLGFLELMGVSRDRLVPYRPRERPLYHARELVLANYHPDWDGGFPTLLPMVREAFLPPDPVGAERGPVVYLDRDIGGALTYNTGRRVVNRERLLDAVRARVGDLVVFRGSQHTLTQTIELFSRARLVFGPHGGAFANTTFMRPGSTVVEFVPADVHYAPTWHAAAALGCEYWAVPVPGGTWASDFVIDVDRVTDLVARLAAR